VVVVMVQSAECAVYDDEGPVCQLRRAEDDRRGGRAAAQDDVAEDTSSCCRAPQVRIRQTHPCETREILHKEQC